jgi:GxxExxY protein
MRYPLLNPETEKIGSSVVDVAYRLHARLGPGLLESVYESLLARGLTSRGHFVERQKAISFVFDGVAIEEGFRADLLVDRSIVVEIKAREKLPLVFERQLLTYMRALNYRLGFLINFGAPYIKDGIKRLIL